MKFEHAHSLGKDEARRRIEKLCDYWHTKYQVAVAWDGDSAKLNGTVAIAGFKDITFDANLRVSERAVEAEGPDLSLLMRPVVTGYFKRKVAMYLDPSKPIDQITE